MDESPRSFEFEPDVFARAGAGINGEHDGQRQLRFFAEDGDFLCYAVFREAEVILGQIADGRAQLICNGDEDVHELNVDLECRFRALLCACREHK